MDLSALQARADEALEQFERFRSGAGALHQRIKALRATAKSDDGYVTVTVDFRGRVERLEMDPRIYRRPDSRHLAESIQDTIDRACADAERQLEEVSKAFLSADDLRASLDFDFEAVFKKLDDEYETLSRMSDAE